MYQTKQLKLNDMTYYQEILEEVKETKKGQIYYNEANGIQYFKRDGIGYKWDSNSDTYKTYYTDESMARAIKKTANTGR